MKPALLLAIALGAGVPTQDAARKEIDKLVGEWSVASAEKGGKKLSADDRKNLSEWVLTKVLIKDDKIVPWISHKGGDPEEGKPIPFTLDLSKNPKQMNMIIVENDTAGALYALEGDTLKVCLPESFKGEAPASFDTAKNATAYLYVFKRAKK